MRYLDKNVKFTNLSHLNNIQILLSQVTFEPTGGWLAGICADGGGLWHGQPS